MSKKAIFITLLILCSLMILAEAAMNNKPTVDEQIKTALSLGKLADLPVTAEKVQVFQSGKLLPKNIYIRFCAADSDIDKFVEGSSSLLNVSPREIKFEDQNLSFAFSDGTVPWFNVNIKKGRVFETHVVQKGYKDTVYIDDENNTVFVRLSKE